MYEAVLFVYWIIDLFGIAGGGGSSSGGGGGGGGSSGGGSFSGGSSSGSGGGSGEFDWIGFVITVLIFAIFFYIIGRSARKATQIMKERRARIEADLAFAAAADVIWEPDTLVTHAKDTFLKYQEDWSDFNLDSMKTYMTPRYYQHNLLMMGAMKLLGRQNLVTSPVVLSAEVIDMKDSEDNDEDTHTVQLNVHVYDILKDTAVDKQLFTQQLSATEYYKFARSGKSWKFDGIDQATASPAMLNADLEAFASKHKFFYSPDWGHLLLPSRGQLFSKGSFGRSDINNHIVGLYKDIIIQLYSYIDIPGSLNEYLIAQTSVPKRYGNIVVRRKVKGFGKGVRGMRKIQMEWSDFNSMYEVWASDSELATSFELLNPKFMVQLQELPFEVNIEVVDNIVYLYSQGAGLKSSDNYSTMLTILKAAFKEMRL